MLLRGKKIIITGGAGFIGSNLARSLCYENDVLILDNLSTGEYSNVIDIMNDVTFIQEDITNLEALRRSFEGGDYVLHQAALPSVQRSVDDPITSNKNNVDGTLNVLVASRDCGVKRVVFASSSSIYGDDPALPKVETFQPNPQSPYAVTKLAGEYYCKVFHDIYGLETFSLRYFNVFGPGQSPESQYAAVVPKFVKAIKSGQRPEIYGDGEQSRDFTYVENVVMANVLACEAPRAAGEAINIGSGERVTLNRLLDDLREILQSEIEPIYADPRTGDVRHSLADISRAKELLGYEPRYSLRKGLEKMLSDGSFSS
jgi:nucleoside-diphosphate-sugar epimerase